MTCPHPGPATATQSHILFGVEMLGFVSALERQVLCLGFGEEVPNVGHSLWFNKYRETFSLGNRDRNEDH